MFAKRQMPQSRLAIEGRVKDVILVFFCVFVNIHKNIEKI